MSDGTLLIPSRTPAIVTIESVPELDVTNLFPLLSLNSTCSCPTPEAACCLLFQDRKLCRAPRLASRYIKPFHCLG